MPRKKTTAKKASTPKKQSKASYVRSLPAKITAGEAVEKAKAAGISLSENYFYNVRATSKISGRKKGPKNGAGKKTPKKGASRATSTETTFRRLVIDLGLARAKALLGDVEQRLGALIAGR